MVMSGRASAHILWSRVAKRWPRSLLAQLALVDMLALLVLGLLAWRGGGVESLWWTPDQQAQRLYDKLQFSEAADRFEAPLNKGAALYDAGRYLESAATFGRLASATGFYNRGNALMRGREYVQAIAAYEQAVAEAPEWVEARENLQLARHVLDYIEGAREQSDTGKMEADDYKFDNTKQRGIDTEIDRDTVQQALSADTWMRTVNTEVGDFLSSRFALEAATEEGP